jgi:dTMP kinase
LSEALFADRGNQPGMLVTIDGPNGSGKTHLTRAVAATLRDRRVAVHETQQPSVGVMGQLARDSEEDVYGRALACLVAGDRHQQVEGEIASHLAAGEVVLCDRYIESSLVLQRLDGVEVDFILAINSGIRRPDIRIRLSAEPEVIRDRLSLRPFDPRRRLERSAGAERELELYEEADRLLKARYGLAAQMYDTTNSNADALGAEVADAIHERRYSANV